MKLATRLSILFVLLSIIPLLIVGFLAYQNGRQTIEDQTFYYLTSIGSLKEREFDGWVSANVQNLDLLAQRPLVILLTAELISLDSEDSVRNQDIQSDLLKNHLIPAIQKGKGFVNLAIIRINDGQIMASTDQNLIGKHREDQNYFIEGKQYTYVDRIIFNPSEGEPSMHISTPILDESNSSIAVLVGQVNLEQISALIAVDPGSTVSEDSFLINDFNYFVTEPKYGAGFALTRTNFSDGANSCLEGNTGINTYNDYRGVQVLGSYRWMPEYKMCLMTEIDQVDAFSPIRAFRNNIVGLGFIAGLIVAVLGVLTSRLLTKPVYQLIASSKLIGSGDLDHRIKLRNKGEIGVLAASFNQMAEDLQLITAFRDDLNKEIDERVKARKELVKERDKAQLYLDIVGAIIVVVDTDQRVSLINQAGCEMLGYDENEIVGQDWFETFIPEQNRQDVSAVFERMLSGDMEFLEYFENPVLAKDGSEKIISWHNTLLVDEVGLVEGTLSSGEDITERRIAERELSIKDFAFESSSSADSIGSNDGILSHANLSFASIWGYENVDEVIGKSVLDFLADREKGNEIVESITKTGKWSGEYKALRKDGSTFIAMSYANAIKDVDGNQTAIYSSVVDITESKAAEREILRLNEELEERVLLRTAQLEEANKELESFAYSVSHDLRAPLRAIDGFSRILQDEHTGNLPGDAQRYLDLIRNNTQDMDRLIDDLLAFSRLARKELSKQTVSPNEVVKRVLEDLQGEVEGRHVELNIAKMPDFQADSSLINQVYLNLIENAIKFSREMKPSRIEIGHFEQDGEQIYFIKDNGAGFDMQYKDKLFGVFQRLHRSEEFEGTGVGLAIVLRIIRRHGGRIWAESEVNQGATFYFTLEGETGYGS